MFTGIVEGLGLVTAAVRLRDERRFIIRPLFEMADITDGESIAVNGACLSVENHEQNSFSAYASGETIKTTNLGSLQNGSHVNLERALQAGARLGGHIVSGHVDCLATVQKIIKAGESVKMRLRFPANYGEQIVSKGSIALNGISLTVNACGADYLEVNVIPDSQKRTNFPQWRIGDQINMETDLFGKYARHLLAPWLKSQKSGSSFLAGDLPV